MLYVRLEVGRVCRPGRSGYLVSNVSPTFEKMGFLLRRLLQSSCSGRSKQLRSAFQSRSKFEPGGAFNLGKEALLASGFGQQRSGYRETNPPQVLFPLHDTASPGKADSLVWFLCRNILSIINCLLSVSILVPIWET